MPDVPVVVGVYTKRDGAERFLGYAGGPFPPPAGAIGAWTARCTRDAYAPLSRASLLGLIAWVRRHAVPRLDLSEHAYGLLESDLPVIDRLPALASLSIRINSRRSMRHSMDLGELPALTELVVAGSLAHEAVQRLVRYALTSFSAEVSPEGLHAVGSLTSLRELRLPQSFGEVPQAWDALTGLKVFDAPHMALGPNGWTGLNSAPLRTLRIGSLTKPPRILAGLAEVSVGEAPPSDVFGTMPHLLKLRIGGIEPATLIELAASVPDLEVLDLRDARLDGSAAKALAHLRNLRHLRLGTIGGIGMPWEALTKLESIQFRYGLPEAELARLVCLPNLRKLTIDDADAIPAKGWAALAGGLPLTDIEVRRGSHFDSKVLAVFARHGRLRRVVLRDCDRIDDAAVASLVAHRDLEHLDLWGCPVTQAGMAWVAALPALQFLRTPGIDCFPTEAMTLPSLDAHAQYLTLPAHVPAALLGDLCRHPSPPELSWAAVRNADVIAACGDGTTQLGSIMSFGQERDGHALAALLRASPRLRRLDIDSIDDHIAASIGHLPILERLLIRAAERCPSLPAALRHCMGLQTVELEGAGIDAATIDAVCDLPAVTSLTIEQASLHADQAARLIAHGSLTTLRLRSVIMDDAVVAVLGRSTSLHSLHIESCPIGDAGFAAWPATHPLASLQLERLPRITTATIDVLARLHGLDSLHIADTAVDDRWWAGLLAAPSLGQITAYRNSSLTFSALEAAQRQLTAAGRTEWGERRMSISHDIPKRVKKDNVISRRREKTLLKKLRWAPSEVGHLSAAVVHELTRLGAINDVAVPEWAAHLAVPLRALLTWRFPSGVTYASDEDAEPMVWSLAFQATPPSEHADVLALQARPFFGLGLVDGGNEALLCPCDALMPEDPPVYLVDHEWYNNEDADLLTPIPLSQLLALLHPEAPGAAEG